MLTVLAAVGVLVVIFVAAVVATRDSQAMRTSPAELADVLLPAGPLVARDVADLRFGVAVRGYRMAEVDAVLARLTQELANREAPPADSAWESDHPAATPGTAADPGVNVDEFRFPPVVPADSSDSSGPEA